MAYHRNNSNYEAPFLKTAAFLEKAKYGIGQVIRVLQCQALNYKSEQTKIKNWHLRQKHVGRAVMLQDVVRSHSSDKSIA